MDHTNDLRILNAETYDDGRGTLGEERRKKQQLESEWPFGVTDNTRMRSNPKLPMDTDGHDSGPRRKKARPESQSQDDEEGVEGKARGRPRVNPKDETAADVSVSSF
jgi:hypothetical protein